jgi:energy-coupling factor transporter transmembrane protein EcfT
MPMYLIAFPLLIIPFVLYNMIAFLLSLEFSTPLFNVPLLSERSASVNTGDALVILAVLLLYLEILKATRLSSKSIMDHVLSMILFLGMAIEFIAVRQAATSTFLILVALAFVDVIGGFTISIRTAQRSVTVEETDRVVTG